MLTTLPPHPRTDDTHTYTPARVQRNTGERASRPRGLTGFAPQTRAPRGGAAQPPGKPRTAGYLCTWDGSVQPVEGTGPPHPLAQRPSGRSGQEKPRFPPGVELPQAPPPASQPAPGPPPARD